MFIKRRSHEFTDAELQQAAAAEKVKTEAELRQDRIEKKAAEMKKQAAAERLEQLEYYKFPNIMGWYFDGTFTKDFTLSEEYAEYFNEIEDELDAQKDLIIDETFTEKAFRYFWPPKFIFGGKYFRTRGIYLDFKEVKEDPPKTPPNINYEKQRGIIGVEIKDEDKTEKTDLHELFIGPHTFYGTVGWKSSRDNWYWCEKRRDFRAKEPDGDYFWSNEDKIWIESDPTYRTPYDWYFDDSQGKFFIRDKTTPDLYAFDQEKSIYYLKGAKGPSSNGLRRNDYCYDEKLRKWLPITQATGHVSFYNAVSREIVKGDRGASGLTPDDFYYDGEAGKMMEKDPNAYSDYYYDTWDKIWKKKDQPYGPGKANHYPMDYEFDHQLGTYFPRHAKECKHIEPIDWFFDRHEGKFYLKDWNHRELYVYDPDMHIFYLKDSEGPSINELSPEDYYWNEYERQWKLAVTVKDPSTMLDYHDAGKRRIMRGDRGRSGKVADDFYYDAVDGSFFRKDVKRLGQYWFDPVDMCWKKKLQAYGPGYFRLYPEHYYFDYDEGYYFPTTTAKHLLAKLKNGEVKGLSDRTPYDFAFNDQEGFFRLRDKEFSHSYRYNAQTGVFHVDGVRPKTEKDQSKIKTPKDFFYDEFSCTWLPIEHPKSVQSKYYKHGKRNNRMGPRGRTGRIPDDFYFNFDKGTFEAKGKDDEVDSYEYIPDVGVWRKSAGDGHAKSALAVFEGMPISPAGVLKPRDYYFDREEGMFIPKKKLMYGEIYLSPFTNLWMQRWRCPQDFIWDHKQHKYVRKPASKHDHGGAGGAAGGLEFAYGGKMSMAQMEAIREAELAQNAKDARDYERPWLHNFMVYAADEIRFEQEMMKAKERDKKQAQIYGIEKGLRKGYKEKALPPAPVDEPPAHEHQIKFGDEGNDKNSKDSLKKAEKSDENTKTAEDKDDKTKNDGGENPRSGKNWRKDNSKVEGTKSGRVFKTKDAEGEIESRTRRTKSDRARK